MHNKLFFGSRVSVEINRSFLLRLSLLGRQEIQQGVLNGSSKGVATRGW
jgi:hypothetical protein